VQRFDDAGVGLRGDLTREMKPNEPARTPHRGG